MEKCRREGEDGDMETSIGRVIKKEMLIRRITWKFTEGKDGTQFELVG